MYWSVDVLVSKCTGPYMYWSVHVLVCKYTCLYMYWSINVPVCVLACIVLSTGSIILNMRLADLPSPVIWI